MRRTLVFLLLFATTQPLGAARPGVAGAPDIAAAIASTSNHSGQTPTPPPALAAAKHVASNLALAESSTSPYPTGIWRDDYAPGHDAPPLFFTPQSGSCKT